MHSSGRYRIAIPLVLTLLIAVTASSEVPSRPPPSPGQQALAEKQYGEALRLLDAELAAEPGNAVLLEAKVDALMGMHRYWDAGTAASSKMAASPPLRYRAGVCLLALGQVAEGFQVLSPLRADPVWADRAYARLVWALRAAGQERDALEMLREGLAKAPAPTPELWQASLELDRDPHRLLNTLDLLATADPLGAEPRASLKALCRSAGQGPLVAATMAGGLPVEIPLGEASLPRDPSGSVSGSPRLPRKPAPSAQRFGSGTYSKLPPGIKYYAEAEDTNDATSLLRCVVSVTFGEGMAAPMILDTAASDLILTPETVRRLALKPCGTWKTWTLGMAAKQDMDLVLVGSLKLGPLEIKNVPAVVVRDAAGSWGSVGGVIPVRLLDGYALHLDRRNGKLTLYPSGTRPEGVLGPGAFRLRARWSSGLPFTSVAFQDKDRGYLLLDITSNFTYLNPGKAAELGLGTATSRFGTQNDRGHAGLISSGVATDLKLGLGPATIYMSTVRIADLSPAEPLECSGILGWDVLKLFDLFLDYGANTVALKGYEKGG